MSFYSIIRYYITLPVLITNLLIGVKVRKKKIIFQFKTKNVQIIFRGISPTAFPKNF